MRKMAWRLAAPWEGARPAAEFSPPCVQGGPPGASGAANAPPTVEDFDDLPASLAWTGADRRLADTDTAETGAAKLTFFDSAYNQQMQGGTHP